MPSPFEIKLISIRPPGFEPPVRSEGVISPLPRKQYVYPDSYRGYGNRPAPTGVGGTTGFFGDWRRTEITTDDDEASSPIRLNQWREAKEQKVRGLLLFH